MSTPWSAASIRVRLTGWYAVVLSLMLVVYASATFLAVRNEFLEQLDDQLHDDFFAARQELLISSPYFVPGKNAASRLRELASAGMASGPVAGISAATTPTGLAIFTSPASRCSSTISGSTPTT